MGNIKKGIAQHSNSYIKLYNDILRNPFYQEWKCTARSKVSDFLLSYVIRAPMRNRKSNFLYHEYYLKKQKLVSRFSYQGILNNMSYNIKTKSTISKHISKLIEEGIMKREEVEFNNETFFIYDFGIWYNKKVTDIDKKTRLPFLAKIYTEELYMYNKFNYLLSESKLEQFRLNNTQ